MTPVAHVLRALRCIVLAAMWIGIVSAVASYCSGCGTTTAGTVLAGAAAVAKPLSCVAARAYVTHVCGDTVGTCPAPTSGGEGE